MTEVEETIFKPKHSQSDLVFTYLPDFGRFMLEHRLRDFVESQIQMALELRMPLMMHLSGMPHDELVALSMKGSAEFFEAMSRNELYAMLERSLNEWVQDRLEIIGQEQIAAEDISLGSYVRKQGFLQFLPHYTSDVQLMLRIISELDYYSMIHDTASTDTYISLLHKRLQEHAHFIEKTTHTTPGLVYVLELEHKQVTFTNHKTTEYTGLQPEQIQKEGLSLTINLVHPEDRDRLLEFLDSFSNADDGEIRYAEIRLKDREQQYKWMRNYASVFRRDEQGRPSEIIGIMLDVDTEHHTAMMLQQRESELLEAQRLADLGSYEMDLETGTLQVTPNFYHITGQQPPANRAMFHANIHPADRAHVIETVNKALEQHSRYDLEYRYLRGDEERFLWSRGVVVQQQERYVLKGTIMDVTERHDMLRRLQRSDMLYKQAQSMARLGNWTFNIRTNQIEWSDEMYRIHDLDTRDVALTPDYLLSFIHPDDQERIMRITQETQQSLQPYDYTYRIFSAKGRLKTLHAKGEYLTDAAGRLFKTFGTLQDVTERHELINRLQRSEALSKQAEALVHLGNWEMNLDDQCMIWSDEMYRILGLEPGSVLPHLDLVTSMMESRDVDIFQVHLKRCVENNQPFDFHFSLDLSDGTRRLVRTKGECQSDTDNQNRRMMGTVQDVTEQMLIERRLRENQRFIQKITDIAPSIIAVHHLKTGQYLYVSKGIRHLLGYEPEQALQQGVAFFHELLHPDDAAPVAAHAETMLARVEQEQSADSNEPFSEISFRLRHRNGQYRWFHSYAAVFDHDNLGRVSHVLHIIIDITQQHEAEQALYHKNRQLELSNSSLEEFAYVASHDLQEPLRKISTFGGLLQGALQDDMDEKSRLYLQKIIDSSIRMQTMISDILSLSTISGDKSFCDYNLSLILDEVLQALESKIEARDARVSVDPLPVVHIVPAQMRQLFQNLLGNALKFTRPGTQPRIRITYRMLSQQEAGRLHMNAEGPLHQIEVTDNGIGFDPQFAQKIFAIFERLHGKSEYEGTGIGLSICKKIMEHHGGAIYADSQPGAGATFTIVLPAYEPVNHAKVKEFI